MRMKLHKAAKGPQVPDDAGLRPAHPITLIRAVESLFTRFHRRDALAHWMCDMRLWKQ